MVASKATFWEGEPLLSKEFLLEIQQYVDNHLTITSLNLCESVTYSDFSIHDEKIPNELKKFIEIKRQPTLKQVLFKLIDQKGLSDPEIYKKAGLDRKLFSKIRSIPSYRPGKNIIIALALALELTKKETDKLLSSAGYSLSDCDTADLVIQFFIEKKNYDIFQVNEALEYFSLKPLVGSL